MDASEAAQRATIVAEARTWLGTPYHHAAKIKGVGVDCLTLLIGVYENVGLIPPTTVEHYPIDWNLHRDAERYREGVQRFAHRIPGPPRPGDVVLWQFGRCFSHGAIVIEWPVVIHAHMGSVCRLEDAEAAQWLKWIGEGARENHGKPRPREFYSLWG
jgi:NlpC/P60 family putative phage cell wall peptidase